MAQSRRQVCNRSTRRHRRPANRQYDAAHATKLQAAAHRRRRDGQGKARAARRADQPFHTQARQQRDDRKLWSGQEQLNRAESYSSFVPTQSRFRREAFIDSAATLDRRSTSSRFVLAIQKGSELRCRFRSARSDSPTNQSSRRRSNGRTNIRQSARVDSTSVKSRCRISARQGSASSWARFSDQEYRQHRAQARGPRSTKRTAGRSERVVRVERWRQVGGTAAVKVFEAVIFAQPLLWAGTSLSVSTT